MDYEEEPWKVVDWRYSDLVYLLREMFKDDKDILYLSEGVLDNVNITSQDTYYFYYFSEGAEEIKKRFKKQIDTITKDSEDEDIKQDALNLENYYKRYLGKAKERYLNDFMTIMEQLGEYYYGN